jgi:ABC-type transport system involved in resistance to organic solvents, ATPase component
MASNSRSLSTALEFRNVSVAFDDQPALIDVSFQLHQGEMILLTGESGSGKSVLLRLAMGLLKPDAGQIFVGDREIETLAESELLAIRGGLMGMVFQENSLFTGLSVFENVAYRLKEHDWNEQDIQKAVTEVLDFVGLAGEEEKLPEHLSGGMKRRVEIARALVGWPAIMLFDEPTMSLDPIVALQVMYLLIRARDINKISSIYVTKKIYELPYLSNYVALPEEDRIVIKEAPSDKLPKTRIIVLEAGEIAFKGSLSDFNTSDLMAVRKLRTLDQHNHAADPHFPNPWDKSRQPLERLL